MNYILECCCDSVESALAAERGGANRIELCANLVIGGTTPSLALFHAVRKAVSIRIHVLLRPRFGDFCYTEYEKQILLEEVRLFRQAGADGIVIGALKPDGELDVQFLESLIGEKGNMKATLHRAFDMCKDQGASMEEAIRLGFNTILTSGGENLAVDGVGLLRKLNEKAQGRISLMAGSGISADAIRRILSSVPLDSFHMSGKKVMESPMIFRKESVSMGLQSLSEYEIWQTDEIRIREAKEVLETVYGKNRQEEIQHEMDQ